MCERRCRYNPTAPYSDFTLESLKHRFNVTVDITTGAFATVSPVPIDVDLAARLRDGLQLAMA